MLDATCWDSSQSQMAALLGLQKNIKFSQLNHSGLLSAIDHSLHTLSKVLLFLTSRLEKNSFFYSNTFVMLKLGLCAMPFYQALRVVFTDALLFS